MTEQENSAAKQAATEHTAKLEAIKSDEQAREEKVMASLKGPDRTMEDAEQKAKEKKAEAEQKAKDRKRQKEIRAKDLQQAAMVNQKIREMGGLDIPQKKKDDEVELSSDLLTEEESAVVELPSDVLTEEGKDEAAA